MNKPEEALAEICSALEYLQDRGELTEKDEISVLTSVRYKPITEIPHFDLVVGDRTVRVTATDIGPHTHDWVGEDYCDTCGARWPEND